jgi:uncharacterized membrane protein YedE/YeeE
MQTFTPLSSLLGGVLIGLAASLALLFHGRVAGISGIVSDALSAGPKARSFELSFLAGLLVAGVLARLVHPSSLPGATPSLLFAGIGGLLVGFGTRRGSGCTSGHGVCGLSRLSRRSLVATATFMATGIVTVAVVRSLGGRP